MLFLLGYELAQVEPGEPNVMSAALCLSTPEAQEDPRISADILRSNFQIALQTPQAVANSGMTRPADGNRRKELGPYT